MTAFLASMFVLFVGTKATMFQACIDDSDCVRLAHGTACFAYMCYDWKNPHPSHPICVQDEDCWEGQGKCQRHQDKRRIKKGVCFRDYQECEKHEDCTGENQRCCINQCCPKHYFEAWREFPCYGDLACQDLGLGKKCCQDGICCDQEKSTTTPTTTTTITTTTTTTTPIIVASTRTEKEVPTEATSTVSSVQDVRLPLLLEAVDTGMNNGERQDGATTNKMLEVTTSTGCECLLPAQRNAKDMCVESNLFYLVIIAGLVLSNCFLSCCTINIFHRDRRYQ